MRANFKFLRPLTSRFNLFYRAVYTDRKFLILFLSGLLMRLLVKTRRNLLLLLGLAEPRAITVLGRLRRKQIASGGGLSCGALRVPRLELDRCGGATDDIFLLKIVIVIIVGITAYYLLSPITSTVMHISALVLRF